MLLKASDYKNNKWHFDQYGKGKAEESPSDAHYSHETHEKMFAWHIPDEEKKRGLRRDADEKVRNGATKGHVAADALYKVLEDFKSRLSEAEGDSDLKDQIMSEMHDWLAYLHAQHESHGLDKDPEFRRAYTDAHTFHSQRMSDM